VSLAGVPATILNESDTEVFVRVSANNNQSASGSVTLVSDSGAIVTRISSWAYVTAGVITSVFPASGQIGTVVNITGTGLRSGSSSVTSVALGGVAGTILSESDTSIVVVAGRSSSGFADIVLFAQSGATVVGPQTWLYLTEGRVASLSPSSGRQGTRVAIQGTNLLGGGARVVSVTLGGVSAPNVTSYSDSVINVIAPSGSGINVSVEIVSDTGAVVRASYGWTFVNDGTIVSVTPTSGQVGTLVTIHGSGLLGGAGSLSLVSIGGIAIRIDSGNDTVIVGAIVTSGPPSVALDVVVISSSGAVAVGVQLWSYASGATLIALSPQSGQFGTRVNISGSNLLVGGSRVTAVELAGVPVSSIVSSSDSLISVVAGASNSSSSGNVAVTIDTGARYTLLTTWHQLTPGLIQTVLPGSGQFGTRVVISGSSLFGGGQTLSSVRLAGVDAAVVLSASNSEVVVAAAYGPAGPGSIELISDSGAVVILPNSCP